MLNIPVLESIDKIIDWSKALKVELERALQKFIDDFKRAFSISSRGDVGIKTIPTNILTVQQGSDTDPIADAWTVYSLSKNKKIIETYTPDFEIVDRFKNTSLYRYKIKRAEVKNYLFEQKEPVKFSQEYIGILAEEAPEFVKSYDKDGNLVGINLVAYIGWLHAVIKSLIDEIEKLKEAK